MTRTASKEHQPVMNIPINLPRPPSTTINTPNDQNLGIRTPERGLLNPIPLSNSYSQDEKKAQSQL